MSNTIFNDIGYLASLRADAVSAPSTAINEVASAIRGPIHTTDDEVDA